MLCKYTCFFLISAYFKLYLHKIKNYDNAAQQKG